MKKFMISIAAICAVIFFVSCGGNSSTKDDNEGGNNTEDNNGGNDGGETSEDGNNGSETGEGDNNGGETNDGDNNGGDNNESDPSLYEKFIGRWAAEIILHSDSVAAGMDAPSITTRYILVDFYVNDKGQLDMNKVDNKLCSTENRTGKKGALSAGNVLFNESKFNTIFWHWKPYEIPGRENTPYVEVAQNGNEISFKLNKDYELRGACKQKEDCNPAAVDNNGDEWFVSGKDDQNIFDHDGDGKDAFTLGFKGSIASTGDMYYVQKLWHIFEGKLVADDKIEGNVEWHDDQLVVGASNPTLKSDKKTTTSKEKSIFQFRKVADDMDCDTLLNRPTFDLVDPNADDAYGRD